MSRNSSISDERFFFSDTSSKISHGTYFDDLVNSAGESVYSTWSKASANSYHPQLSTTTSLNQDYTALGLSNNQTHNSENNSSFSLVKTDAWDAKQAYNDKMIILSSDSSRNSVISKASNHAPSRAQSASCVTNEDLDEDDCMSKLSHFQVPAFNKTAQIPASQEPHSNYPVFGRTVHKNFSSATTRQDLCFGNGTRVLPAWVDTQHKFNGTGGHEYAAMHYMQMAASHASCQPDFKKAVETASIAGKANPILPSNTTNDNNYEQLPNMFANCLNSKPKSVQTQPDCRCGEQMDNHALTNRINRELQMLSTSSKPAVSRRVVVQTAQVDILEDQLQTMHLDKAKADQALNQVLTSMDNLINSQQARIKEMEQELEAKDKELAVEKEKNTHLEQVVGRQKNLLQTIHSLVALPLRFLTHSLSKMLKAEVLEQPLLNLNAIDNMAAAIQTAPANDDWD